MFTRIVFSFFCFLFTQETYATHFADPSNEVYAEGFNGVNSGWGSWSSTSVIWSDSSLRSFRGSISARAVYNAQWGGFSAGAGNDNPDENWNQSFPTVGYKHLTFAVYNETLGDDLWLYAQSPSGAITNPKLRLADYAETKSIPQGVWTWIRIPVADLRLGTDPRITQVAIQSGYANSIVHFDDIGFKANVTFYEGVRLAKGPSILLYYWNLLSQPAQLDFGGGDYYLEVRPATTWGGIQLQQQSTARNVNGLGISSVNYGGLSLLFKKTTSTQEIHVSLVNENGIIVGSVNVNAAYLPTTLQPMVAGKWYRVLIPISHFFSGTVNIAGVVVESSTADVFYIDDVVLVQKLDWVMKDYPKEVSGYRFGDLWNEPHDCPGYQKFHVGVDYRTLDTPRKIYAPSRGYVKETGVQGSAGGFIILQHEADMTTTYLHTDPISGVSVGIEVQRGAQIGTSATISGRHLHFNLRIKSYDGNTQNGALPMTRSSGCDYPGFPAYFIDPEMIFQ